MKELLYITGNEMKFRQAAQTCQQVDIVLRQGLFDIPEIQAANGEDVARDKATKAFVLAHEPLVVSDDSWIIPGLKGFPGPYMKYMNDWLNVEDWHHLTHALTDRRVILRQVVVYQESQQQKVFSVDIPGELLDEPRGINAVSIHSAMPLVSFDGGKHSVAEHHAQGNIASAHHRNPWHDFAEWYNNQA